MATNQATKPQTTNWVPKEAAPNTDQSVYVSDQNIVKTYPRDMTNNEIDFDLHTTVRGNKPEDYFVNFLPLNEVQQAWKTIDINGEEVAKTIGETAPGQVTKGLTSALAYEADVIDPALKLATQDPAYAFGFKQEVTPQAVANTYKPWLDLWRESALGSKATAISDKALVNGPSDVNPQITSLTGVGANMIPAIPWFFVEFAPDQLLQFGTKASNWVGVYGIEKFGPPILNKILSKLPDSFRSELLVKAFKAEKAMASDFETLGMSANSKTSSVVNAYRDAAKMTHPDLGGDPEEFIKINQAYEKILKSRNGWMDNFFDLFRQSPEFKASQEVMGLLGNEKGSAIIPFSEGDLVKMGGEMGKIVKIAGDIAAVNVAGKIIQTPLTKLTLIPKGALQGKSSVVSSDLAKKSAVNLDKMQTSDDAKLNLIQATDAMKTELENQTGESLTHEEVINAAKEAEIISKGVSREATLAFEASLLKTRQHLAALAEQNELTPEFLDTLRVMSNIGTDIARNLESFKIQAMPEFATAKVKIIKDLIKLGKTSDEILKAAQGVDFNNERQVAKFYREFVKPTIPEILDEFVYMNILSSPLTHIVNATSNILQLAGLNPLTKLASGAIDNMASRLTGKEREHYISEVPEFYKGALNSFPKAFKLAGEVMKGNKNLERPDVKHLPTLSPIVDWATLKLGKYVTRALEASDVLFRTMIEAGETQALSKKLGHAPDPKELGKIQKEAKKLAEYYVFRQKPDSENKSGQGDLLSAIDKMTNAIYRLRAVPGLKWFIRFVQTPMNIVKQGIEYSPAGFATLKGAKDKSEQAGKAIIGSFVFAGASWLAANNLTTWAAPTGAKEKNEFYASGLQPYSVKIGDKWVSYSKLGPLAYPLAMASALHYFSKESPTALSDSEMDKAVDGLTGIMKFFSDQSYMQGLGDLVSFAQGEKSKAISSIPSQLVPLSSLQGWVNNIIDPLQRKAEKGLSIKSVVDQIQLKIVGMSKFVPPQIDSEEMPVKKQMREVNAFSPIKISKIDQGKLSEYKDVQRAKQEMNKIKKEANGL